MQDIENAITSPPSVEALGIKPTQQARTRNKISSYMYFVDWLGD